MPAHLVLNAAPKCVAAKKKSEADKMGLMLSKQQHIGGLLFPLAHGALSTLQLP